jgi:hypothetical protein
LREGSIVLHHVFAVTSWTGNPSIRCDEHVELRWFDFDAVLCLPNRTPIDFPLIFARIRALRAGSSSRVDHRARCARSM